MGGRWDREASPGKGVKKVSGTALQTYVVRNVLQDVASLQRKRRGRTRARSDDDDD